MQSPATVTLYAEDFSRNEESRRPVGTFPTHDAARAAAEERVRADLGEYHQDGQTARELFALWTMFGEDVFLVPDDPKTPFSAMDYARLAALEIAGQERGT